MFSRPWKLLIVVAAACSRPVAGGETDGAAVFAQACAICHGEGGKPTAAMVAQLAVRDLTAPEFRAKVTAEGVELQVRMGSANKLMPSFLGALTEAQIKAVARHVAVDLGRPRGDAR
jgi:cytochrome c6